MPTCPNCGFDYSDSGDCPTCASFREAPARLRSAGSVPARLAAAFLRLPAPAFLATALICGSAWLYATLPTDPLQQRDAGRPAAPSSAQTPPLTAAPGSGAEAATAVPPAAVGAGAAYFVAPSAAPDGTVMPSQLTARLASLSTSSIPRKSASVPTNSKKDYIAWMLAHTRRDAGLPREKMESRPVHHRYQGHLRRGPPPGLPLYAAGVLRAGLQHQEGLRQYGYSHRLRPDYLGSAHGLAHDVRHRARADRPHPRDRHRLGLSIGRPVRAFRPRLHDRDRHPPLHGNRRHIQKAVEALSRVRLHNEEKRRRLYRLGAIRSLPEDHRDGGHRPYPAAAAQTARPERHHGHTRRAARRDRRCSAS